jgi:two-component system response regulator NreC
MKQLSVVVADDSEVIRIHLGRALAKVIGLDLLGFAVDGAEVIRMFEALNPDVLVLDISMPNKDGLEVLMEIRKRHHEVVIIMFTADPSPNLRKVCLERGANFFLDKSQLNCLVQICEDLVKLR